MRTLLVIIFSFAWLTQAVAFDQNDYFSDGYVDQFVNETFFKNKQNGIFVDIGAHAGIMFSNTYFFEKNLNWNGLCIEPSPTTFKRLLKNRTCTCINAAIANENTVMQFVDTKGGCISGLLSKYEKEHLKKWQIRQKIRSGAAKVINVQCIKLNDLLEEHNIYHIDFLDIDTEGGEFEILQSIDYDKFHIDVINVEVHSYSPDPRDFLESKNFKFIKRVGRDLVFQNLKTKKQV